MSRGAQDILHFSVGDLVRFKKGELGEAKSILGFAKRNSALLVVAEETSTKNVLEIPTQMVTVSGGGIQARIPYWHFELISSAKVGLKNEN